MKVRYTARVRRGFAIMQGSGTYGSRVEERIAERNRLGTPRAERWTAAQCADLRAMAAWLDAQAARVAEQAVTA